MTHEASIVAYWGAHNGDVNQRIANHLGRPDENCKVSVADTSYCYGDDELDEVLNMSDNFVVDDSIDLIGDNPNYEDASLDAGTINGYNAVRYEDFLDGKLIIMF